MIRQILDKKSWNVLREEVRNNYDHSEVWEKIIALFKKRINDYYFVPIARVKDSNSLNGEGFTILTIQCALIEMLAAFKYGKIHNHRKRGALPSFEYTRADECFIPFLHTEKIFENHFFRHEAGEKITDEPFNANEFYNNVRCGLMHEARTKGEWVINARKTYLQDEKIFIKRNIEKGVVSIDRTILNKLLSEYFESYLTELSAANEHGNNLRRLFARKLDHLYDILSDSGNYDWWKDY
ncbi:hypothetical protein G4D82_10275 [Flavobacterium sp. CYK-4]|uniref:hypothetical protein n=1 Tax=Flavobacterium lotistagni TaxID=2709660 RepID=UPI0014095237|nr:hypothetical protein [Flavobacterium lotistagni]NHM07608.1 hypothetical protein [Flavobacterium lotistagni]